MSAAGLVDLGAIVAAAVAPLHDELRALRAEVAELRNKREATRLSSATLAERLGKPSVEALNKWMSRKREDGGPAPGAHVKALAKLDPNGKRYWLAAEIDALTTRGAR